MYVVMCYLRNVDLVIWFIWLGMEVNDVQASLFDKVLKTRTSDVIVLVQVSQVLPSILHALPLCLSHCLL